MTLDKLRIKCKLGDEIRVVTTRKDVSPEELLRILEQDFGRPVTVTHYEDHERDLVTISATGLQAVLSEHAELHSSTGPLATLKLFLQPSRISSSGSEDLTNAYSPFSVSSGMSTFNSNKSGSTGNITVSSNSGGSSGGSFYSSSPRNGSMMGSPLNGHIGNGPINVPLRRNSSKFTINMNNNDNTNHPGKMEIDLTYLGTPPPDIDTAPPLRTPPRTPPDSPHNPLRTPPGSPKGGRNDVKENPGFPNFHNLRVDTEPLNILNHHNSNHNSNHKSISPRNTSPRNTSPHALDPHNDPFNLRYPHYLLHPEPNSAELNNNINLNGTPHNDTPPIRTPPQSPRGSTPRDESPPVTPSSLPPVPWLPIATAPPTRPVIENPPPRPALEIRHPPFSPPFNPPHAFNLEPPSFPAPHSPQAIPVPIPFPLPKSPRIGASPKLPPSIIEQNKQEEEKGPIRWEKGPVVGRGGFGCVYMGMRDNGELIAVKQLELDETEDPKSRSTVLSFAQEIDVMRTLRHENIVRYLGIQVEDKFLNIFLEYVAGGSISTLLGKFVRFPEPVIRVYTKQILQGIAYLHDHRIVHRDIKGANILVDGTVKLADFGCSKIFAGLNSRLKTVLGTPYWMAPEVIKQSGYGRSADIWSLGCVIIEMATGQPPWQAQFSEVTAAMFHIASTESLPDLPPHLSPEAHDFLSLCFKRSPKERPNAKTLMKHPFLQDVAKDLVRRNSFHGPEPPPPGNPPTVTPWPKHNRAPSISTPPLPLSRFPYVEFTPASNFKFQNFELLPSQLILSILRLLPSDLQIKMRYVCKLFSKIVREELWVKPLRRTTSAGSNSSVDSRKGWSDDKINHTSLKGHIKSVHCLCLGETFLVSGGDDKKLRMWDVKRARRLISLKGHTSTVTGVCVDASNNIFSASADMTARIWAPFKNGTLTKKSSHCTLSGHTLPLTSIALADGGTKIATGSYDKSVRIWDVSKGAHITTLNSHDSSVNCVQCDGMMVISGSRDSYLKAWDLRTPSHPVRTFLGHVGEVNCCYLANNRLLSGGEDKLMRMWDVGTGKLIRKFDHSHAISAITCDETKIVSGGDKLIKLWDWESETCARVLSPLPFSVLCLETDGLKLFTGQDKAVRILSPETLNASTPRPFLARLRL